MADCVKTDDLYFDLDFFTRFCNQFCIRFCNRFCTRFCNRFCTRFVFHFVLYSISSSNLFTRLICIIIIKINIIIYNYNKQIRLPHVDDYCAIRYNTYDYI